MKRNTFSFFGIIILLFIGGCTATSGGGTTDSGEPIYHKVAKGENLWDIDEEINGGTSNAERINAIIVMNKKLFPGGLKDSRISYGPARYHTPSGLKVDSTRTWRYALIKPGERLVISRSKNIIKRALVFLGNIGNNSLNFLKLSAPSMIPSWLIGGIMILLIATLLVMLIYRLLRRRRRGRAPQQEQQEGGDDTAPETNLATT